MATFKPFIHVERLEPFKFDIPDFLNDVVFIFAKLDGTNFCAWADESGNIHCGSRKREITREHDNAQSCLYFTTEPQYEWLRKWLQKNPDCIIYGEWLHGLGVSKQTGTIKDYKKPGLWIIDVFDTTTNRYVPYYSYSAWFRGLYDQVEEPLAVLDRPTFKEVQELVENHFNLPDSVLGEGIVVKNYNYLDKWGKYQVGKIVNAESKVGKGRVKVKQDLPAGAVERMIVDSYVTDADCEKAKQKACVQFDLDEWVVDKRTMGFYLNCLFNDLIEEEMLSILKKLKMPTIQFSLLRKLVYQKGREYLGLV